MEDEIEEKIESRVITIPLSEISLLLPLENPGKFKR